jgi:hypothetical protein
MTTSEHSTNGHRVAWAALGLLAVGAVGLLIYCLRTPPQMGVDEHVFNTVDALYTAVRNHDEARLAQCARRLTSYREAGQLPAAAGDYLDGVIAKARDGDWDSATRNLYDFMLAQRREGAIESHHHRKKSHAKAVVRR